MQPFTLNATESPTESADSNCQAKFAAMYSFYAFNRLNNEDKSEFTFDEQHCTYLLSCWENDTYSLNLYYATNAPGGAYFIEVLYNEYYQCIESFRSYKTHRALEPYLNFIDISEVWP